MKINATHQREEAIKKISPPKLLHDDQDNLHEIRVSLEESLISMEKLQQMMGTSKINASIIEPEKLVFRNNSLAG